MVCITNKTVMLSKVIREGYGELRQWRKLPALSTHSGLRQDFSWGGKREKDYKGDFSVGGRGFYGNSRKEGKPRAEMVDLLLVHWEFLFVDVQR